MKKSKNDGFTRLEFDSYREILEFVKNNKNPAPYSRANHSSDYAKYSWNEIVQMMEIGWDKGTAKIDGMAKYIKTKITEDAETCNINFDVTGDYLDMGRYMTGEPETFGQIMYEKTPTETVDITVDIGTACAIDTQTIYNRGAAITTLVEELQKQYFVNLKLIIKTKDEGFYNKYTRQNEPNIEIVFNIDMQGEYSRDLLAVYIANSSFLRRICWAIFEVYLGDSHAGHYGFYGKQFYKPSDGEIFFSGMIDHMKVFTTEDGTIQEIKRILNNQ